MKDKDDLVQGWLRKAASDVIAMEATLRAGSLDGACFHAQQAAEKYLKAYLTRGEITFPYTHNLAHLTELCAGVDPEFQSLSALVAGLTPYAVRSRYDHSFWPGRDVADEAVTAARKVRDFVLARMPSEPNG